MKKDDAVWLKPAAVRARFGGISDASLYRWENDPQTRFPKAARIHGSRFWNLAEIEEFEARALGKQPLVAAE